MGLVAVEELLPQRCRSLAFPVVGLPSPIQFTCDVDVLLSGVTLHAACRSRSWKRLIRRRISLQELAAAVLSGGQKRDAT
jgi:hypothetical protein